MEGSCKSLETRSAWGGWRTKLGQEIHCIFCVNAGGLWRRGDGSMSEFCLHAQVLHYVSPLGEPSAVVAACVLLILHAS